VFINDEGRIIESVDADFDESDQSKNPPSEPAIHRDDESDEDESRPMSHDNEVPTTRNKRTIENSGSMRVETLKTHDNEEINDNREEENRQDSDEEYQSTVESTMSSDNHTDTEDELPDMDKPAEPSNGEQRRTRSGRVYAKMAKIAKVLHALSIPAHYGEAVSNPNWRNAIRSELDSLEKNKTWDIVKCPKGRKLITGKWVFALKQPPNGETRYKARWVARGFSQRSGIDYTETFSPVIRHDSLRVLLALTASKQHELVQLDVETAYLNGDIEEEIYLVPPQGYTECPKGYCLRLLKCLYGLKQAGRQWYKKLTQKLTKMGFKQSEIDPCIFFKHDGKDTMIIGIYVDDLLISHNNKEKVNDTIQELRNEFKLKTISNGPTYYVIGNEIHYDIENQKLFMNQQKYINDKIKELNLMHCNPVESPMSASYKLSVVDCPDKPLKNVPYREAVGGLMHAALNTRFDISTAVGIVSKFFANPGEPHWNAVKRILRYLKGTAAASIVYDGTKPLELIGYSDASFACDPDDGKSISGYTFMLVGGPIAWKSKKQSSVAGSTTEAEYIALSAAVSEAIWLKNLLQELTNKQLLPVTIHEDNQACIRLSNDPMHITRVKHVQVKYHFIRDKIKSDEIILKYCPTKEMLADLMTKPLVGAQFEKLRSECGMISMLPVSGSVKVCDSVEGAEDASDQEPETLGATPGHPETDLT
jgi:hypothetical protein